MINLDMTFEDMKKEIGSLKSVEWQEIKPSKDPDLFRGGLFGVVFPGYKLYFDLAQKMGSRKEGDLTYKLVRDILYNAYEHGNNCSLDLPIKTTLYGGNKRNLLSVEDCGDGFDPEEILIKMDTRIKYFQCEGRGFFHYKICDELISWNEIGNIIYVLNNVDK